MGDAVNVAARMEQTAEPGTVQITADTARLVRAAFDLGPPKAIAVKGKAEPIVAHLVLGRKPPSSSASGSDARATPLVGREREMATLRRVVDEALEGRGGMVALIGEPGLGKSRLIEETRAYWSTRRPPIVHADGDIRRIWEVWQCVSFDTARPYAQYRRMLSAIAGIADTDPPDVVRDKLAKTVEPGAPEWLEPHMRVWRSLLGVPEPGEDPLEGEAFRSAIMDLVPRSTRAFGADPRLLVFEDLHWCDEASMDLLIETATVVEDLPSLLLFAFRPDREAASWRLKRWLETEEEAPRSTEIRLTPLSEDDSCQVDRRAPPRALAIRGRCAPGSSSGPRATRCSWRSSRPRSAPTARTTRFPTPCRPRSRLVWTRWTTTHGARCSSPRSSGARSPSRSWARSPGTARRSASAWPQLERAGLIREIARDPEPEYAFHHSLTQEAAYGTILRRDRRALHGRVGIGAGAAVREPARGLRARARPPSLEGGRRRGDASLRGDGRGPCGAPLRERGRRDAVRGRDRGGATSRSRGGGPRTPLPEHGPCARARGTVRRGGDRTTGTCGPTPRRWAIERPSCRRRCR